MLARNPESWRKVLGEDGWLRHWSARLWRTFSELAPKGLYARALIIIIAPIVLLESVVAFTFMERHWSQVTKRLSEGMARNMAASGQATVLYVCFEHEEDYLVQRMIAMESALATLPKKTGAVKIQDVRQEVLSTFEAAAEAGQVAKLGANPRVRPSLERIARYGNSMYLMRGTATDSTIDNLRALVDTRRHGDDRRLVLFVDYLQKVPVIPEPSDETEKVTRVVNGLKDIALASEIGVVAIVAADREGLKAKRLRNHHLRGSSAINYEADIILILNDKYNIVAKVNIEFNPYQAQRYRDWVVATVEKNRGGQDNVDLEWQKLFQYSCFDPNGRITAEKLIEERLYTE